MCKWAKVTDQPLSLVEADMSLVSLESSREQKWKAITVEFFAVVVQRKTFYLKILMSYKLVT